ncbi:MAG: sigma-70 family RNA polymerase sigma factor [Phycisphaeraceae bacterium]|nr:sigma-70 family RNA polymerase sigma factor [Phycisphaerales bacterium]MCB9843290.1 sigma-70 family RNA polymerase sigma factor [Phycisphaeraceae bacterium]
MEPARDITVLLSAIDDGDSRASEELLPLVYDELRRTARAMMERERGRGAGYTLQPTALVHEAYMRLVGSGGEVSWANRRHFFGAAAQAMRRILVERARRHRAAKHGGGRDRAGFHDDIAVDLPDDKVDMIALDDALNHLSQRDERKAEIVHLRYFAGLTIEETAAAMELSPATIKSEWSYARLWLFRELEAGA